MTIEKTFPQPNGDLIFLSVWVSVGVFDGDLSYRVSLFVKPKGKRQKKAINFDNYEFRPLSNKGKLDYQEQYCFRYMSPDDLQAAKMELWEALKPIKTEQL